MSDSHEETLCGVCGLPVTDLEKIDEDQTSASGNIPADGGSCFCLDISAFSSGYRGAVLAFHPETVHVVRDEWESKEPQEYTVFASYSNAVAERDRLQTSREAVEGRETVVKSYPIWMYSANHSPPST